MAKFAKYPSCFGKLDLRALCEVARKHGMKIICASKPDMHVHNEIGLAGTAAAMKKTEAEWAAHGNTPKPRGFKAVFGVNLDRKEEDWVDNVLAAACAAKLPIGKGWPFKLLHNGTDVMAPEGWRKLKASELPESTDFAWNREVEGWAPVLSKDIEDYGAEGLKEVMHGIIRKK
jgi:hypothetical protein